MVVVVVVGLFTSRTGNGSLNAATDLQFEFAFMIKQHRSFERSGN